MSTGRLVRNLVLSLLTVAVIVALFILLPGDHPVSVFVSLAVIVLLSLTADRRCTALTIPLFGWMALHVVLRIASIYVEATWLDTVRHIIDLWLPGIFALLGAWAYARYD